MLPTLPCWLCLNYIINIIQTEAWGRSKSVRQSGTSLVLKSTLYVKKQLVD